MQLQVLLAYILLTLVYNVGQLFVAIKTKVVHSHYFLGFGSRSVDFRIAGVLFSLGIFVPIFPFARIYKVDDGKKERANLPWEFHQSSIGRRILATIGGTITLFLSGIFILIVTSYFDVEEFISKKEVNRWGIYPSELALQAGFQNGDRINSVNGRDYNNYIDLLLPETGKTYQITRDGKDTSITISKEIAEQFLNSRDGYFLYLETPLEAKEILPNTPAYEAGLMKGDQIVMVNGISVSKQFELKKELLKDEDGQAVLSIERKDSNKVCMIEKTVGVNQEGTIGILIDEHIQYTQKRNTLFEAVVKGVKRSWKIIYSNIAGTYTVISGGVDKSGSNITIGKAYTKSYTKSWDWNRIGALTGSIFVVYGLLTLFPLPRAIFWELIAIGYEGISRKSLSLKAFKRLIIIGYVLFGGLILINLISDFMRAFM